MKLFKVPRSLKEVNECAEAIVAEVRIDKTNPLQLRFELNFKKKLLTDCLGDSAVDQPELFQVVGQPFVK